MKDQRGPAIRALSVIPGQRLHWRYVHGEQGDMSGTVWLFECVRDGGEWWCIRQITPHLAPHPDGASAYDWEHLEDQHGFLTDQPLPADAPGEEITAEEFELEWRAARRVDYLR